MPNERNFANGPTTTLAALIADGTATTISVTNGAAFPLSGDFTIKIDNEILLVTAVSGNTWTVTRGAEGSTAVAHPSGAIVVMPLTKDCVDNIFSVFQGGSLVGTSRRINLVDSGTVAWTIAKNGTTGAIDISAAASGGGGGGGSSFPYEKTQSPLPLASDFTFINNTGSTTVSDTPVGLNVYDVWHNGVNRRMFMHSTALPAVPWSVTARLDGLATLNGNEFGIFVWDDNSGSSTYKNWDGLAYNNTQIQQIQANNATGATTVNTYQTPIQCSFDLKWFRICQHNSKRYWQISKDGYNWWSLSVGWDYLMSWCPTPTKAGFYVNANNNWNLDLSVTCGYFKVETWTG